MRTWCLIACVGLTAACSDAPRRLTFSGSAVGAEGRLIRTQLERFAALHPGTDVDVRVTPDAADQRHQLYVQWLNARSAEPDVLQLDVVWTPEFAAAGWILPVADVHNDGDFLPAAVRAAWWQGRAFAVPWFVDLGLLYWRTDLFGAPPVSLGELRARARAAANLGHTRNGLVFQGARYEGLVTVFLEYVAAFGGGILDASGAVIVDEPPAVSALTFMRDAVARDGITPAAVLAWQEEQSRFAFQNGQAAFMRNWPYAWNLLQDPAQSRVAGRVGVVPLPPGEGGVEAATLGGAHLAVNRFSEEPDLAAELVRFLTAPDQMLARARATGQWPARRSLLEEPALADALSMPIDSVRRALDAAVERPVTPVYSELSELLQVHLHRALSGQEAPGAALRAAADDVRALLARSGLNGSQS